MIILLLIWFYRRYRWRGTWSMALTSLGLPVVACSAFLMFLNWVPLVQGLGKDPTISGRTQIWGAVLDSIWDRPWFGFGRSAFWQPGSVYALRAGERVGHLYVPPHGHNGLLDLLLDVGFVGVFLFLVLFLWVYGQSLWLAYHAQSLEDYWPAVYLPFLAMNNMTESYLLRLENPYWVLFMLVALSLPPLVRQRQQSLGAIGAGAN
jgi:O-antigen ligase